MSKLNCDACGSEDVVAISYFEKNQLTLGDEFSYEVPMFHCNACGEEGDFSHQADEVRESVLQEARTHLAAKLIDDISNNGMKLAHIERVFELPQRTIASKWKRGSISASGVALLRIISTMPWITDIAEKKFTVEAVRNTVGHACEHYLKQEGVKFSTSRQVGDVNRIQIHIHREVQGPGVSRLLSESDRPAVLVTTNG